MAQPIPDTRTTAAPLGCWNGEFNGSPLAVTGFESLTGSRHVCAAAGYAEDRILIDPSVVRGLEYYTGPVFEAELLAEIPNEKGQPVVFGSVGGGGRYDGLVGRFLKEEVPATGFSIGVSRLQAALAALGKLDTSADARPGRGHRHGPRPSR